jgi:hypothetical protein
MLITPTVLPGVPLLPLSSNPLFMPFSSSSLRDLTGAEFPKSTNLLDKNEKEQYEHGELNSEEHEFLFAKYKESRLDDHMHLRWMRLAESFNKRFNKDVPVESLISHCRRKEFEGRISQEAWTALKIKRLEARRICMLKRNTRLDTRREQKKSDAPLLGKHNRSDTPITSTEGPTDIPPISNEKEKKRRKISKPVIPSSSDAAKIERSTSPSSSEEETKTERLGTYKTFWNMNSKRFLKDIFKRVPELLERDRDASYLPDKLWAELSPLYGDKSIETLRVQYQRIKRKGKIFTEVRQKMRQSLGISSPEQSLSENSEPQIKRKFWNREKQIELLVNCFKEFGISDDERRPKSVRMEKWKLIGVKMDRGAEGVRCLYFSLKLDMKAGKTAAVAVYREAKKIFDQQSIS